MSAETTQQIVMGCFEHDPAMIGAIISVMEEKGVEVTAKSLAEQVIVLCGEALLQAQDYGLNMVLGVAI